MPKHRRTKCIFLPAFSDKSMNTRTSCSPLSCTFPLLSCSFTTTVVVIFIKTGWFLWSLLNFNSTRYYHIPHLQINLIQRRIFAIPLCVGPESKKKAISEGRFFPRCGCFQSSPDNLLIPRLNRAFVPLSPLSNRGWFGVTEDGISIARRYSGIRPLRACPLDEVTCIPMADKIPGV